MSTDDRVRAIIDLHFHPDFGSQYWLARQAELGLNARERIRTVEDLSALEATPLDDLRKFPVRDFIPQTFRKQLHRFILGETAGTSGLPRATAYRDDEFQAAFVAPFLEVARATGFPENRSWLWIGPSGPHIIGKAVRELARQMGSIDPFSVDFDARWVKKLAENSIGLHRYVDHVVSQALDVINREEIGVLFTTPPTLAHLSQRMTDKQRESIRGVHYGGLRISAEQLNDFREEFPNAVHLSGYGNTLFGVVMEVEDGPRQALDYYPHSDRIVFELVEVDSGASIGKPSQVGRVCFHRLDESCLLVGVTERDEAEWVAPSPPAIALGWKRYGLRDPHPPAKSQSKLRVGLY
jgi:phenylacetate-coenzyme A ligase PaaK-like adenylate-forming protein